MDADGISRDLAVDNVKRLQCTNCGEEVFDEQAMHCIDEARRAASGLLTASELKAFRTTLRKSQREMSALMGIGETTYQRWEAGAFQTESFDRLIRLLMLDAENVRKLEEIKSRKKAAVTAVATIGEVFSYLKDLPDVEKWESQFVSLMESGTYFAGMEN